MRDTCQPYRTAIYNCLNGNLGDYNSIPIQVSDEKKKVGNQSGLWVILSTQQETPADENDCTFITLSSIDIEIINKTGFEVTKDDIDTVSDTILGLIIPDSQTSGLIAPSGFQFHIPIRTRAITRNLSISFSDSDLLKILTITTKIVEQN